MKRIMISLLSLCMILCFAMPVSAQEDIAARGNIKTLLISPEGETYIEYADVDLSLPQSRSTVNSVQGISDGLRLSRANAPTYTYSLKNYNQYTYLWALSESSYAIDYMKVYCIGYYSGGGNVGEQTKYSPSGWSVSAMSAIVETPKSALPLEIASGKSIHTFQHAGYQDVTRSLSYKK